MKRVFVKPAQGVKVRNPEKQGQHIPAEGGFINWSAYWVRRAAAGDVKVDKTRREKPAAAPVRPPAASDTQPAPAQDSARAREEKKPASKKEG